MRSHHCLHNQRADDWLTGPLVRTQALLTEHVAALWLAYKPLTRPDRALLER